MADFLLQEIGDKILQETTDGILLESSPDVATDSVTKSLQYAVVSTPSTITKSLQYAIDDGLTFTREAVNSLGSDDTDLATAYSQDDKDDVATDNGVRVTLNAVDKTYNVHQFRKLHTNGSDEITVTVDMQCEQAPSSRTVTLQIYDFNGATWETLDSDSATAADTDFVLTGSPSGSPSNYYNGSDEVVIRVYQ